MEAIVLVGGQGTRLRPLTLSTPKPMLPLAGVPFLTHMLARAAAAGVDHAVLATSYRAEVFEQHFGTGASLGLRLDYVTEEEALGTGGAMRNVVDRLDARPGEPVLVLNGDILSGHDIDRQVQLHRSTGAAVTLHLVEVEDARAFGCVPTAADGRVTAFLEKSPEPVTRQVNAGCYVFTRSVLDGIPAGRVVSVERETFPGLLADGARLTGYLDTSYWLDVGTPAAFVQGSADVVRGRITSPALPAPPGDRLVAPDARVEAGAVVDGGSAIGARTTVAAGAVVRGSVVGAGVTVETGAVLERCAVAAGARIGAEARLVDAVVGDGAEVGAGNELTSGARVWPHVVVPEHAIRFSGG